MSTAVLQPLASALSWPTLPSPTDYPRYVRAVQAIPMLEEAEERELATAWRDRQDKQAAWRLVLAHLRLVTKVVREHAGYGMSPGDLAQEGTVGLMKAVRKFDPARGIRLGVYALRWIEAEVREYIVRNWRQVKLGTTAAMKKLFFGYRHTVAALRELGEDRDVVPTTQAVAQAMDLSPAQVAQAEAFFRGQDMGLSSLLAAEEGDQAERADVALLAWEQADGTSPEAAVEELDWEQQRHRQLAQALRQLPPREREILEARRLQEPPVGLVELGERYAISAERVRQLENQAMKKVTGLLRSLPAPALLA